jgi:para-nitrobenzyl esterase
MYSRIFMLPLMVILLFGSLAISCDGGVKPEVRKITLDGGVISGTMSDGVPAYLGIPFAAPPVGDLRWREPQPVKRWDSVLDCSKYAPACPQPKSYLYDVGATNEDCLYLNVWSTAKSPDAGLPVMVWIHGGSYTTGAGSQPMYDGKNLARQDVVVVTVNYRLGPLGFLSHPLLSKESPHGVSGNYGLLDQIAALKWVKKNIQSFGGDPTRVTVFGESAGAASICSLMISPLAEGLFQRAISESGSFGDAYPLARENTVGKAEKTGLDLAVTLGCDKAENGLAAMRQKTADDIIKAAYKNYDANGGTKFRPVTDGWVIPGNPWSLFTVGKQAKVPLLIGTNANEGTIFILPKLLVQKITLHDYEAYIKNLYKDNAAEVLARFPAANTEEVPAAYSKMFTIMSFAAGALHAADTTAANNSTVYMYKFTRIPDTALKRFGSFHGLEIFYLFGIFKIGIIPIPDTPADSTLSQGIMKYWTNFARTGNPNSPGLPDWPAYSADKGQYIEFGDNITASAGLYEEYRELINRVTGR